MAVADRLAHGDDVGHHPWRLERPPMAADAAEADLHLVGHADAAGGAHHRVDFPEIAIRQEHLAGDAGDRFRQEQAGRTTLPGHLGDLRGDALGKPLCVFADRPFGRGAVAVGNRRLEHMRRPPLAAPALVFVGAEVDEFLRRAVIAPVEHDRLAAAGTGPCHAQHQAVGLTAGAGEGCHRQAGGQRRRQPFGIGDDGVVQIARVGVELGRLARDRLDHVGAGMAEMADIVEAVEIGPAAVIDQPGALAAHELDRLGIGNGEIGQQRRLARRHDLRAGTAALPEGFRRNAGKLGGIGNVAFHTSR